MTTVPRPLYLSQSLFYWRSFLPIKPLYTLRPFVQWGAESVIINKTVIVIVFTVLCTPYGQCLGVWVGRQGRASTCHLFASAVDVLSDKMYLWMTICNGCSISPFVQASTEMRLWFELASLIYTWILTRPIPTLVGRQAPQVSWIPSCI